MWVSKYTPRKLDDMVLEDEHRNLFNKWIQDKEFNHSLFLGSPGSGKTTIARILIDEIVDRKDADLFEINGSSERGIDIIRDQIKEFLQAIIFGDSKIKVVFIDEFDGMTKDAQNSLRNIIETYSSHGRFLLTANHEYKIEDAIKSRTSIFRFKSLPIGYIQKHCEYILNNEKIEFNPKIVTDIINCYYPDVRKIISTLQIYSSSGQLSFDKSNLEKDEINIRSYLTDIINYSKKGNYGEALKSTEKINNILRDTEINYHQIFEKVFDDVSVTYEPKPMLAEYLRKHTEVPCPRINFMAFCYDIIRMFAKENKSNAR